MSKVLATALSTILTSSLLAEPEIKNRRITVTIRGPEKEHRTFVFKSSDLTRGRDAKLKILSKSMQCFLYYFDLPRDQDMIEVGCSPGLSAKFYHLFSSGVRCNGETAELIASEGVWTAGTRMRSHSITANCE